MVTHRIIVQEFDQHKGHVLVHDMPIYYPFNMISSIDILFKHSFLAFGSIHFRWPISFGSIRTD